MCEFFTSWRRKFGVVTLAMALGFTAAWGRSLIAVNRVTIPTEKYNFTRLVSFNGSVACQRVVPVDPSKWSADLNRFPPELFQEFADSVSEYLLAGVLTDEDKFEWKQRLFGLELGECQHEGSLGTVRVTIWKLSYWSIIVPLTLLSAFLLLANPSRSTQKKLDVPIGNERES